jgi:hypothetical protein
LANGKHDNPSHRDPVITGNHSPMPSRSPALHSQPHASKGKGG